MDITPFIRELILSSECIILRGIGGFDTSYKNALLDKNKKLINPPGKKITFRPDWIKDNGTLEKHIANSLHIKTEDASKYIDLFVEDLLTRLADTGNINLEGIGNLRKNKSGTLEFFELKDETYLVDSFGLDTLDIENETSRKEIRPNPELTLIVPKRRKKTGLYVIISLLLISVIITSIIIISGNERISLLTSSKKTEKAGDINEVIVFGPKNDKLQDSITKTIEQTLEKSTAPKKALSPDISTKTEPVKVTTQVSEHIYFLVAGSFKNLKNAEILKTKLENKGFKPEILTNEGSFVRVIIGKFNNKNEAITELQRIRGQINLSVWIMKK